MSDWRGCAVKRDWIEGRSKRVSVAPASTPKATLIERIIASEWRIRLVWALRAAAFGAFAYWQPAMAASAFLGALFGYNFGFKDARRGWIKADGTPFD